MIYAIYRLFPNLLAVIFNYLIVSLWIELKKKEAL